MGKLIGSLLGLSFGGFVGLLLGLFLGWRYDRAQRAKRQQQFVDATFLVMGRLCKADGHVSKAEIQQATSLMDQMNFSPAMRQRAIRGFERGKSPEIDLHYDLGRFSDHFGRNQVMLDLFFQVQLGVAWADGHYGAAERRVLLDVCDILGLSSGQLAAYERQYQIFRHFQQGFRDFGQQGFGGGPGAYSAGARGQNALAEAYTVLGVSPEDDEETIKKAYRRLMSTHHPDKLVARGLPEEMVEVAKQKTQEIQAAWEIIKASRRQ
jgi:DnaJ like chaperone protein